MDDIDHLGNRRVRGIGELLENQIRIGLSQMARIVRERMNIQDKATLAPRAIMNAAPVVAIVRKFFGSSQLSQFMDQTNPWPNSRTSGVCPPSDPAACTASARDLKSATCITRITAAFARLKRRKVQTSALISSLACYARVNQYGLIESPYRKVIQWPRDG